ncbi:MAG TPA: DUF3105 domain-containing protein [Solirubrobacterales bacterium]|nr:DUF3105 domain-containing protein [Solirubrobacterales bacterium]
MGGGAIGKRVVLGLVAGLVVLVGCGGGGSGDPGSTAHVNEASGSPNGAVPDERVGSTIPPAPAKGPTLFKAAKDAGCFLLRKVPAKDDEVVSMKGPAPEYEKEPPMVGPHVAPPDQQADGAYLTLPDERATVASLDHGRMTIQYAPDLPENIQLELKGLYDTMYGGTLLFPNNEMYYAVAATTWSNGLFCPGYEGAPTLDAIREFGEATWGRYGDEPVTKFPVQGPTPANPEEPRKAGHD